ncbi:MAG: rhodanese-like domain-containing protein, partial [Dehalococcoidales bacterium]|nr:rhodanese-like domain-containing protein [Dehalococcoidales bacterium]
LQYTRKDDFIKYKMSERLERPPYFSLMEKYNQYGPPLLERLPVPAPLSPSEFRLAQEKGAVVVDTSLPAAFVAAHIKDSYSIWLEGLSAFAGWVLPYNKPIILVMEKQADIDQAVRYLIRVGYDNIKGFLKNGIEEWYSAGIPIERLPVLSVQQLKTMLDAGDDLLILDVRDQEEWQEGHIPGSVHIYVGHLEEKLSEIPRDKSIVVTCSIGHRSGLAASILQRDGFQRVFNLLGGITAWRNAGLVLAAEK